MSLDTDISKIEDQVDLIEKLSDWNLRDNESKKLFEMVDEFRQKLRLDTDTSDADADRQGAQMENIHIRLRAIIDRFEKEE